MGPVNINQGGRGAISVRLSYDQLRQTLNRFEYFRHWTNDQIRECSILARVVQYAPQETIPLDLPLPLAYLVLSGQCMIMQCLQLVRGSAKFHLAPVAERVRTPPTPGVDLCVAHDGQLEQIQSWHETFRAQVDTSCEVDGDVESSLPYEADNAHAYIKSPTSEQEFVHHFLDVGSLSCGAVFGLGERHEHRTIVARTRTQCLVIPRCWLFLKPQNIGNTWQRLCMYLDWAVPARDELYRRFLRERAWLRYRQRLMRHTPKRPSGTVLADVPIMCRLGDSTTTGPPDLMYEGPGEVETDHRMTGLR